jgi:hypothetical protein
MEKPEQRTKKESTLKLVSTPALKLMWYVTRTIMTMYWRYVEAKIALDYGLDDRGSTVRFPAGDGNSSLHHRVQTGSGAHPASYPMGARGSFLGSKLTTHLHLVPRSRMRGGISPLSQYAFMAWCSVKKSTGTTLPLRLPYVETKKFYDNMLHTHVGTHTF